MTVTPTHPSLEVALADLPTRVRVHDLAKRAGIGSKEMIGALADAGVPVGSASSSVDRDTAVAVLTGLLGAADDGAEPAAPAADTAVESSADPTEAVGSAEADESSDDARPRRRRGRGGRGRSRTSGGRDSAVSDADRPAGTDDRGTSGSAQPLDETTEQGSDAARGPAASEAASGPAEGAGADGAADEAAEDGDSDDGGTAGSRRRRRGRRGRGRGADGAEPQSEATDDRSGATGSDGAGAAAGSTPTTRTPATSGTDGADESEDADDVESESAETGSATSRRRRRRRRGAAAGTEAPVREDDPDDTVVHVREPKASSADVVGVRGSTRLEAKRQRRKDTRDSRRRPQILSEAEFLARRESVERVMAIRERGDLAQVALLEDGVLVEHFVSRTGSESMIGNVYLGRVQNVLPSMEAAFVDIGRGRNAVLYAGEVNWDMAGLVGKARRIETALSSGDTVLVQVSKDPIGHKGSRLTSQISLPGRFLVYVPGGGATGISRKLPDTERRRLKAILDRIVPDGAGVIIRTAAEGVAEAELIRDVERLREQWEQIETAAAKKSSAPAQLYGEPGTLIKVIRDLFNSDITSLVVDGDDAWAAVSEYVLAVAPELAERVGRYVGDGDIFGHYRVDEQIAKALERKVHLPSGGSLVIDRTEAMTVVDVNTGKFTGSGGNLEETVTRNNIEAAEEIVRQLRLRDIGGIIVVDFIDMVLESNRELVLRRLTECLGRDRTRHQVAEVTSLGLVQMTRKRMGIGLVEAFSEPCPHCGGRGILLHDAPVAGGTSGGSGPAGVDGEAGERRNRRRGRPAHEEPVKVEPLVVERVVPDAKPDPRGPRPPAAFRAEDDPGHPEVSVRGADQLGTEVSVRGADQLGTEVSDWAADRSDTEVPDGAASQEDRVLPASPEEPATPKRRRRVAGRPAGAPLAVTEVLDLVIPVAQPTATQEPANPGVGDGTTSQEAPAASEPEGTVAGAGRSPRRRSGARDGGTSRTRKPRGGAVATADPAAGPA